MQGQSAHIRGSKGPPTVTVPPSAVAGFVATRCPSRDSPTILGTSRIGRLSSLGSRPIDGCGYPPAAAPAFAPSALAPMP